MEAGFPLFPTIWGSEEGLGGRGAPPIQEGCLFYSGCWKSAAESEVATIIMLLTV